MNILIYAIVIVPISFIVYLVVHYMLYDFIHNLRMRWSNYFYEFEAEKMDRIRKMLQEKEHYAYRYEKAYPNCDICKILPCPFPQHQEHMKAVEKGEIWGLNKEGKYVLKGYRQNKASESQSKPEVEQ